LRVAHLGVAGSALSWRRHARNCLT
jgi:hypothetical protein